MTPPTPLSSKIIDVNSKVYTGVITVEDVRTAIMNIEKKLKERIVEEKAEGYYDCCNDNTFFKIIEKVLTEEIGSPSCELRREDD